MYKELFAEDESQGLQEHSEVTSNVCWNNRVLVQSTECLLFCSWDVKDWDLSWVLLPASHSFSNRHILTSQTVQLGCVSLLLGAKLFGLLPDSPSCCRWQRGSYMLTLRFYFCMYLGESGCPLQHLSHPSLPPYSMCSQQIHHSMCILSFHSFISKSAKYYNVFTNATKAALAG